MEKNNNFSNITLEQLAQMIANEFASIRKTMATKEKLKKLATKDELDALAQTVAKGFEETATKTELDGLRKEMQAGFSYVNITLDKHMGDVREQTDSLAHRVKRLEESVFGAGK